MGQARTGSPRSERTPSDLADTYCGGDAFARRLLQSGPERVTLARGEALFRQGDPGDSMYLLLHGRLTVQLEHQDGTSTHLTDLGPGAPVGEMALLTGQPRTASIYAATDVALVRCSRTTYDRLAAEHPGELAGFTRAVTQRMREVQMAGVLVGLFGDLDLETLSWLRDELAWIQLDHGDLLFQEGDPGDAMYIVISGRLRVTTPDPGGGQRVVGEVSPGEVVGELGLLSGEPRAATAVAIRESHAVRMSLPVFERLAQRYPNAMMRLTRLIIKRQQRSLRVQDQTSTRALALTLVPISCDVPLALFAQELADCLGASDSVLMLDSSHLDDALGKPGAAQALADDAAGLAVSAWLSEQETRYRYLLYVADMDWSPWTQRCVCQADRLLLVGDAHDGTDLAPVERTIGSWNLPVRQELVLLYPPSCERPVGTERWLSQRRLHTYHHVRLDDRQHLERFSRRLSGRAVGLALSGGGARGLAHIGALRAIDEMGIPVDVVGGTSMGALLGAGYASGRDWRDIADLSRQFGDRRQIFDYTLPLTSLTASRKVTRLMQLFYGDLQIEDLWHPFFCVSSNLTRAEPVVHRSGPLWEAVRSSIAIPGVFTPILHGSDVLADGGAMNNFPVDIVHDLCEGGTVLGVNVCPPREMTKRYDFGPSISGWRVLWSRINPFTPRMPVPSLVGSLVRVQEINSISRMRHTQNLADVLIQPDVSSFGATDYAAHESLIEIGYQAAREQLSAWNPSPRAESAPYRA